MFHSSTLAEVDLCFRAPFERESSQVVSRDNFGCCCRRKIRVICRPSYRFATLRSCSTRSYWRERLLWELPHLAPPTWLFVIRSNPAYLRERKNFLYRFTIAIRVPSREENFPLSRLGGTGAFTNYMSLVARNSRGQNVRHYSSSSILLCMYTVAHV